MIVGITISCCVFVISHSCVKDCASVTNVSRLVVGAFDLVNCYPYVIGFNTVLNNGYQV